MKRIIITAILTFTFTALAVHAVTQTAFSGAGVIESTTGGFKFPDGTVQLSATLPPCTAITYLPYTILEGGVYCLTGNLSTSVTAGSAITVSADNVVIDLNGWTLDGSDAGISTAAKGIYANQLTNITIRNGTIRGFGRGILLEDTYPFIVSRGHVVEGIRAEGNTLVGMIVMGSNNILRRNQIVNTGGGSVISSIAIGIWLYGPGGKIIDNDISDTVSDHFTDAYAYGMELEYADGAVVEGNRIDAVYGNGTGDGWGIIVANESSDLLVIGNRITRSGHGIIFGSGTSGKFMNNFTNDVATPFSGGTDSGGND